ncbi:Major cardiolipin synthase ClsA [bioreactor metagenome]|uniref:Major cardiolipin synthase ClsA n=1 Tax=bioreactor metagenome TaxID=1076179 RepID=A0A645AP56_9ZZZZ
MEDKLKNTLKADFKAETLKCLGDNAVIQASYLERMAYCPVYGGTDTEYFSLGDLCFPRILEELRKAERYIFLEFFIIHEGVMWNAILEILAEKAAAGVDVRVIYDDFGCILTLPRDYDKQLEEMGIRCCVFNRLVPVLSVRLNNRSHRKLLIIDGKVGFTGGVNLADEYINQVQRFGHWKDSAILLRGEAVWSMTVMFLIMWDHIRELREDYNLCRPDYLPGECPKGMGFVQPYADSPLDGEAVGETVYLNLIARAHRYVYIMTPYLIIDDTMNTALSIAAKSGLDIRIMTPRIPDKKIVFEVTRAHYEPLLRAGVKIYEYTPGFVHAKSFVVDDEYGVVGSINMDYRSLFLHFENGVLLYHTPSVPDIRADFEETLSQCREMTLADCMEVSIRKRILRAVLRVFAPMF